MFSNLLFVRGGIDHLWRVRYVDPIKLCTVFGSSGLNQITTGSACAILDI